MKILMLLDHDFQADTRVENEILALTRAGHSVTLLCLSYGNLPLIENKFGAEIVRIKIPLKLKKKISGLNNSLFNIYPVWWKRQIVKFARYKDYDALHVHDLWMLDAAIRANENLKIKLIADLHENYVYALTQYKWSTTFPGKYIVSIDKWKKSEKEWLSKVDAIIVVIEEAKKRVEKLLDDRSIPIEVVSNYVNLDEFRVSNDTALQTLKQRFDGRKVLCYTGGFDKHRGLENVVEAVNLVKDEIPNLLVVLVGSGSNIDELKHRVDQLNLNEMFCFEGWQDSKLLPDYIKVADVCMVPHVKSEHTDNTIPHKLFQYMLFEKPVLVSNCDPLVRIVSETKCGEIFIQTEPRSLADSIIKMFREEHTHQEYGNLGRRAVLKKYNWSATSQSLLNLYERFKG